MSTLVGIKRPPGSDLPPISRDELVALLHSDSSLSFVAAQPQLLRWSGGQRSRGMDFTLEPGEITAVGTPDDATLKKMQELADKLQAQLVTEEGEFFSLHEPPPPREPLTRAQLMLRIYAVILLVAAAAFLFFRR
jgi:hypothetical protein